MGNCVPTPASKLKSSSFSRTECVRFERPIRRNPAGVSTCQELDGKEGVDFSHDPWLESDCEDFFTVNGDLTPSSCITPIHQDSEIEILQINESVCLEPHETDVKKQLIELFRERFSDESGSEAGSSNCDSVADIVFKSVTISNTNWNPRARKATQFAQRCVPKLMQSLSFSERKRR